MLTQREDGEGAVHTADKTDDEGPGNCNWLPLCFQIAQEIRLCLF